MRVALAHRQSRFTGAWSPAFSYKPTSEAAITHPDPSDSRSVSPLVLAPAVNPPVPFSQRFSIHR